MNRSTCHTCGLPSGGVYSFHSYPNAYEYIDIIAGLKKCTGRCGINGICKLCDNTIFTHNQSYTRAFIINNLIVHLEGKMHHLQISDNYLFKLSIGWVLGDLNLGADVFINKYPQIMFLLPTIPRDDVFKMFMEHHRQKARSEKIMMEGAYENLEEFLFSIEYECALCRCVFDSGFPPNEIFLEHFVTCISALSNKISNQTK